LKLKLDVAVETWPLAEAFTISRGSKHEAQVVVARLSDGRATGRGECVPYAHYGETIAGVVAAIRAAEGIADRRELQQRLPPGAARNALDCACWDLEAKASGRSVAEMTGIAEVRPILTCYTLSLAAPEAMAARARALPELPLLKLKLGGGPDDMDRMRQVRSARPDARLVVDANEAWDAADLQSLMQVAAETGVEVIEQPLPAGRDAALAGVAHAVPICADESAHTSQDIAALRRRYDAVNIKLDKAGGLTEALDMLAAARAEGLKVMVGSMVATSLSMAPAVLLAQGADWADLDGPLLLARDRAPGLAVRNGMIAPGSRELWG
jgi:L-alanine-DL-glutamate epimerase-like enolase superfamily enzyme